MASAAASTTVISLSLLVISVLVLLLLRHYLPLRTTPSFLLLPIFLAIFLPASAILLVPIDLASNSGVSDIRSKGIWLAPRPILVAWRLIYWLTFTLTWFILPLLGEYMDSGHRNPNEKLVYSLRSNGRYQLIMLACAVVYLVYLIFSYGFDFAAIKSLVIALAYVWGLILAIYLAGHGMVAIPRSLFRKSNAASELRRIQSQAVRTHDRLDDAIFNLDEITAQIHQLSQRKNGTALGFKEWIEDLSLQASTTPSTHSIISDDASTKVPAIITERYLADLTRRLDRAQHRRARYMQEWDHIVSSTVDLQAVLDSRASKKLVFMSRPPARYSVLTPYTRYFLHSHLLPYLSMAMGGILALASISIVLTEIIKFPLPSHTPISLTVIHTTQRQSTEDYRVGFGGQIISGLWLTYMVFCALSSIPAFPAWNGRALVKRNTHPEAACWYASYVARLTVPLAYNFLTFLPRSTREQTTFYNLLGNSINLTALGTWFDYLFPMFILVPVCATLFNLYGRATRVFGFGFTLSDDDDDDDGGATSFRGWREGRDLIARDLEGDRLGQARSTPFGGTNPTPGSPRTSLAVDRSAPSKPAARAAPARWVPPEQSQPSSASIAPGTLRTQANTSSRRIHPPLDPEPEEENFFTSFGRRVKNTIDGIEAPKWMQKDNSSNDSASSPLFKKPKWIDGGENAGSSGSGSGTRGLNFFGRSGGQITL